MIYPKDDKRRLYQLMYMYLNGQLVAWDFCTEFFKSYVIGLNKSDLDEVEHKYFGELDEVSQRFSSFEEDLKIPHAFFNEEQLKAKIHEVLDALGERSNFLYSGNRPDNPVF